MTRKRSLLFPFLLLHFFCIAQPVQMADTMRSNGKIYVVVAVMVAIFAGIIFYLVRLDRKLTKLEKNHHNS